ncbi:putative D,D-dipeptide transport ATP-binding protein DdpD [Roseivivax jejudonensis]|uniref:Putative D,D-dipeptide transport ATP-binding protein DdpD n=1 Tax=Roseivivax jejudonensis TaxID=1529041 RepID=A0A1X6ZWP0_9RHOB|nr:ABC transporter ATP-binding protein [Roseivivax jejudonensis]SLN63310.1 putative D,D-dipeptide transport ATP-binding protein DdpD [Roseivivax jejudonensis]
MSALLRIEGLNVSVGRGGPRLLRDVSLSVAAGETHGLVGESGAGKSMIGKAIAGVLPRGIAVRSGRILFDGQDLTALPRRARRRLVGERIAIIPQDPLTALNPCRRIGGQITDRLVHILGWDAGRARARAAELLDEVAIREPGRVMQAYPHEVSGGMRQRVLIAAAFAAEPALIIADEPTTALDVTVQRQVLRLIGELQARHGTALLFVTHDMGVVAKLCRSLSVLYAGKVVDQGPAARIFGPDPHPYARALIAATPRYDRPEESLMPVPEAVIAALDAEVAAADRDWTDG